MKRLLVLFESLLLLGGMFALSACFYGPGDPGYAYGPHYGYAAAPPVIVGDYDEHHVWHDRDWWVSNRHDWVLHHHPEWDNDYNHRG